MSIGSVIWCYASANLTPLVVALAREEYVDYNDRGDGDGPGIYPFP